MARSAWFDPKTNELLFNKYMQHMDSWERAMADGVIEEAEVQQQAQRVEALLRAIEPKLSDELHGQLTDIFYELAVYYGMAQAAELAWAAGEE